MDMNKAFGSAGGVGLGGALATVVCWFLDVRYQITPPPEVALALGTIFSMVTGFAGAYVTPHSEIKS
jgi:hypothetical protein